MIGIVDFDEVASAEFLALNIELVTIGLEIRLQLLSGDRSNVSALESQCGQIVQSLRSLEERAENIAALVLRRRAGLSDTEFRVLLLLAAVGLSQEVRSLLAASTNEPGPDPTLQGIRTAIYGQLPSRQAQRELGSSGVLRRSHLIECTNEQNEHETRRRWVVSTRALGFLHGDAALDGDVSPFCQTCTAVVDSLVVSESTLQDIRSGLVDSARVLFLMGAVSSGKRTLLCSEVVRRSNAALAVDCTRLEAEREALRKQMRMIAREAILLDATPVLCDINNSRASSADLLDAMFAELLEVYSGRVLVTCTHERPAYAFARPVTFVEMKTLSTSERTQLWHTSLAEGTVNDAELLADAYPFAAGLIVRAGAFAKRLARGEKMQPEHVFAGIRAVLDDGVGRFAQRLETSQTWNDIVLSADQADQVNELIARVRERRKVYEDWGFGRKLFKGLGVIALFSGPPGTGKSMVASLIAKDLGLEIYQVDMSRLTSKWVGETEKNLAALFDAAESGYAILLFDEADSLFGKRTDVKSSNDRHANSETNYLLQRIERYSGICLLTTNHESGIDPAFQRRLSTHVRFAMPDEAERQALWQSMLPSTAPTDDIDFAALASRYVMSGGYIRNAVLRAAFIAASEGGPIKTSQLVRAATVEYAAMGKIV